MKRTLMVVLAAGLVGCSEPVPEDSLVADELAVLKEGESRIFKLEPGRIGLNSLQVEMGQESSDRRRVPAGTRDEGDYEPLPLGTDWPAPREQPDAIRNRRSDQHHNQGDKTWSRDLTRR